jgi:hypothetical protein
MKEYYSAAKLLRGMTDEQGKLRKAFEQTLKDNPEKWQDFQKKAHVLINDGYTIRNNMPLILSRALQPKDENKK